MTAETDETAHLTRARLCELAEVERGKHRRWQERRLLAARTAYGLLDLLQAAQLDELSRSLGPSTSAGVWGQVREDLGIAGTRLEVVVELATLRASIVRSDTELGALLPRGEKVVVIDLSARSARAQERFRSFLASEAPGRRVTGATPESAGREAGQSR